VLAIGVLVWWYRRRLLEKAKQQATPPVPPAKDVPARAEDVLNRPDPNEKPDSPVASSNNNAARARSTLTYGSYDANVVMGQAICSPTPSQVASVVHNPFDDTQSIQTTGTHGSNVIQIALVPPVDSPQPFPTLSHRRAVLNVVPTSASNTSPSLALICVPTPQLPIPPNLIQGTRT
jgi:hypothetical protein